MTSDKTSDTAARETKTVTQQARSGRVSTVETALTMPEALEVLRSMRGNDFAASLLNQAVRGLSASSYNWLFIVAQQELDRRVAAIARREADAVAGPARPAAAPAAVPTVGDMKAIFELFAKAGKALKRPKIKIETAGGRPVVLGVSGPKSKYPGSVSVATGEPFGTPGSFFGFVHPDGATTVKDAAVLEVLTRFAADPAGVAAEYGRTHDLCCFCRRPLSNGESGSVSVGYGPICAKVWDLPWAPNAKNGFVATQGNPLQVVA